MGLGLWTKSSNHTLAVMTKSHLGFVFQGQPGDQAALFAAQARPSPQLPQFPGLQQAQVPMFAL